uniref:J domain-containing protein n=1 Tax=Kalanchoe fedtschenkoi TaxID=63787 RepID=A0A7N0SXE6_KALFE
MQSVFNRERAKHQKRYETWTENQQNAYTQDFQRHDWYWKAEYNFRDHHRANNYRESQTSRPNASSTLSYHYTVLGLDRTRTEQYTDSEIKKAFRAKALQFHPDQNQGNTEAAEAKFKEVMVSYEAIKKERKSMK